MTLKPIGKVSNLADEKTMHLLSLWKDSVSIVELERIDPDELLFQEYSHYMVIHDPLDMQFSEKKKEWNRRFCRNAGVSVVEPVKVHEKRIYFKGLFAAKGSSVYGIVPYTSFDSKEAEYPSPEMEILKAKTMDIVLPQVKGKTILDVGCGIGSITLQMAEMNPGSKVTGIDLSDDTMKQCRLNAVAYDMKNAYFKAASVYDMPFGKGEFETVTCFFMLHHLDDVTRALKEIKKILDKEGKVLAIEPLDHHHGTERGIKDWIEHFEEAGFSAEAKQISRAVIITAIP